MIVAKSSNDVMRMRHPAWPPDGPAMWITSYFGRDATSPKGTPAPGPDELFPCAYQIDHDPGVSGPAHYHDANEFQVVTAGAGRFGKEPIGPLTVHYAGGYSPYGPIVGAEPGLKYMTLRDTYSAGARQMPENRAALKAANTKPRQSKVHCPQAHAGELLALTTPERTIVLAPAADGMAAWAHRVPPNGRITGSDPAGSGGQFWLVTGGTLAYQSTIMPANSTLFLSVDEGAFHVQAGADGLEILELQFPHRSGASDAQRAIRSA